jgi:hypothetical protein
MGRIFGKHGRRKKKPRKICLEKLIEREHLEDLEVERNIILHGSQRDGIERFRLKYILLMIWNICWPVIKMIKFLIP